MRQLKVFLSLASLNSAAPAAAEDIKLQLLNSWPTLMATTCSWREKSLFEAVIALEKKLIHLEIHSDDLKNAPESWIMYYAVLYPI